MSRGESLIFGVCFIAMACTSPGQPTAPPAPAPSGSSSAPVRPTDDGDVLAEGVTSLPPRAVCLEEADGSLHPVTVTASLAGAFDPSAPLPQASLNWMAPTIGCVSFPGASTRTAPCGDPSEPLPIVAHVLCNQ